MSLGNLHDHFLLVHKIPSNIVIDAGNTQIKIGQFINSKLAATWEVSSVQEVVALVQSINIDSVIISSVSIDPATIKELIKAEKSIIVLNQETPVPINNVYQTKGTLGLDRLAAVVGAESLFNGQPCLVVDIGTCITYEFLDEGNNYHGGSISPGVELRFKSMHDYTENLPLIEEFDKIELVGSSTKDALVSGVINGISAEIDGIIDKYREMSPNIQVILCGGGVQRFESKLKNSTFASPKLVLIGLNRILEYNEKS